MLFGYCGLNNKIHANPSILEVFKCLFSTDGVYPNPTCVSINLILCHKYRTLENPETKIETAILVFDWHFSI